MKAVLRLLDPNARPKSPSGCCALAVMTKAPRPGRVKTRLVPPLTPNEAATLNACFLRDTTVAISSAIVSGGLLGKACGVAVKLLPTCYDVDDFTTLRRLCKELLGGNSPDAKAPETTKFLREIIDREGRSRIWPSVTALKAMESRKPLAVHRVP